MKYITNTFKDKKAVAIVTKKLLKTIILIMKNIILKINNFNVI